MLYHLCIFHGSDGFDIDRDLVGSVRNLLDEVVTTPQEETDIDVWLFSPGGDAHAAYKLALELRHRAKSVRAVVPDAAKSAATLLVLVADRIFMGPSAELGPLDVQLEHPDRENVVVSGLDVVRSLEHLSMNALTSTMRMGNLVLNHTHLSRAVVLEELLAFYASFTEPAVAKIDPHLVHRASNELRVAESYAVRLLNMRSVADEDRLSPSDAAHLARRLVHDYPAHGYVISRREAEELGLPVGAAESHPRWAYFQGLLRDWDGVDSILAASADDELDEAEPTEHGSRDAEAHSTTSPAQGTPTRAAAEAGGNGDAGIS